MFAFRQIYSSGGKPYVLIGEENDWAPGIISGREEFLYLPVVQPVVTVVTELS
jgi:hypothetical protein